MRTGCHGNPSSSATALPQNLPRLGGRCGDEAENRCRGEHFRYDVICSRLHDILIEQHSQAHRKTNCLVTAEAGFWRECEDRIS
jgi:hypothetical protein